MIFLSDLLLKCQVKNKKYSINDREIELMLYFDISNRIILALVKQENDMPIKYEEAKELLMALKEPIELNRDGKKEIDLINKIIDAISMSQFIYGNKSVFKPSDVYGFLEKSIIDSDDIIKARTMQVLSYEGFIDFTLENEKDCKILTQEGVEAILEIAMQYENINNKNGLKYWLEEFKTYRKTLEEKIKEIEKRNNFSFSENISVAIMQLAQKG